jgi:hypothetical protein
VSNRLAVRRFLLWLGVAVFFVATGWGAFTAGDYTGLVGFAGFPIVGAIILSSSRGNGVGWLLYLLGMVWVLNTLILNKIVLGATPPWVESIGVFAGWYEWGCIPLIGLLFPTGRVQTAAGRVLAWTLVGYCTIAAVAATVDGRLPLMVSERDNPFALPEVQTIVNVIVGPVGVVFFVATIVGIIIDLAVRWRRSAGVERLQYRWLVWGLALVVACVGTSGLFNLFFPNQPWVNVASGVFTATINLIPISIGIAVTRHGLYEIGRVVSRTVAYAIVTVIVVGVYALCVTWATLLLPQLQSLGVALPTLAAAAVFLPVVRVVQRAVDRRFDRDRYNAQKVVEAFGEHLRTDVTPDSTAREFVEAVEKTLQPASVGLWTAKVD